MGFLHGVWPGKWFYRRKRRLFFHSQADYVPSLRWFITKRIYIESKKKTEASCHFHSGACMTNFPYISNEVPLTALYQNMKDWVWSYQQSFANFGVRLLFPIRINNRDEWQEWKIDIEQQIWDQRSKVQGSLWMYLPSFHLLIFPLNKLAIGLIKEHT